MRKYKKQEFYNCIKTLRQAHQKLNHVGIELRNEILPQCQEMAIQIGTEIDNIEGEGTLTVSCLEQYCEEVYQAAVSTGKQEWNKHQKEIDKLLKQIENSIRFDIPDSPAEVVFLPYKASMWDALDSVYRATIKEENCQVIVMPIPYYNINAQGEILSVEYEGSLFPEDIPITDFREYDIEKHHPDVIFIHNPYDECNRVTQVPQKYFSSMLVNQTERLIYIPYFVAYEDKIKPEYCIMPAVLNAWRTFVQSDEIRKCYIESGVEPQKVVAMGSPKFDMVVKMHEIPPEIPEEWKEALDGRKIFLLNTHLNPLINEAEKMIDKLHQIFALFCERDDVALLWRPHPLSMQTAKSMNPAILNAYMQLVEEFKKMSNGVYDESADLHRAIRLSDAYIGSRSSLVALYRVTGKPICLLNVRKNCNVRLPEKDKCLQFSNGAIVDGELWTVAENHNGLYRVDMKSDKAQFVTSFEEERGMTETMYRRVVNYKDKLYFIPWLATYIAVYNLKTGEKQYILPECIEEKFTAKFSEAIKYKNFLYLFPARALSIVRLNMDTHEIEYYSDCCEALRKIEWSYVAFTNGVCLDNKALLATRKTNCFVEFNLDNQNYSLHYLKKSDVALLDLVADEENIYILNVNGEIYKRNVISEEEKLLWKYRGNIENNSFFRIIQGKKYLYLLPYREEKVVVISKEDGQLMREQRLSNMYKVYDSTITKTIDYLNWENRFYICPANANRLLEIDCSAEDSQKRDEVFIEKTIERNWGEFYLYQKEKKEENISTSDYTEWTCPLECFLDIVVSNRDSGSEKRRKNFRSEQKNVDGSCGEKIWKYIKAGLGLADKDE